MEFKIIRFSPETGFTSLMWASKSIFSQDSTHFVQFHSHPPFFKSLRTSLGWVSDIIPLNLRPSQWLWGTEEQGHLFQGTRERRSKMRGTNAILGNIENQSFDFREQGNKSIYFRGIREQVPPPPPPREGSKL